MSRVQRPTQHKLCHVRGGHSRHGVGLLERICQGLGSGGKIRLSQASHCIVELKLLQMCTGALWMGQTNINLTVNLHTAFPQSASAPNELHTTEADAPSVGDQSWRCAGLDCAGHCPDQDLLKNKSEY